LFLASCDYLGVKVDKQENIHPGEVLWEGFLPPLWVVANKFAKDAFIPQTCISKIIKSTNGNRVDTTLRKAALFGTSPKFWRGLQTDNDSVAERKRHQDMLNQINLITGYAARKSIISHPSCS
jgi:addiction module HigA family antidote